MGSGVCLCTRHKKEENTLFGREGFSKIIRHSLVSPKLRRAEGYEEAGMILRGCACNKTTHNAILNGDTTLSESI